MTGVQFAIQNLLARFVLKVGIVQRTAAAVELDWRQYMKQGEGISSSNFILERLHLCNKQAKAAVCTDMMSST